MGKDFLGGEELTQLVARARALKESGKIFSDLIDEDGNQYVDLVQEGGGVLGISLVGYTYILEQAGIRFYSLAGTSAGAISTLLMASLENVGKPVSVKLLQILADKNLFDLVDGPRGIKRFLQNRIEGKAGFLISVLWHSCSIYFLLKNKLGLNPGDNLKEWLSFHLNEEGICTYKDLKAKRSILPELHHRKINSKIVAPKLAIVTSEVSTHTKVEFPKMAHLYWQNVSEVSPSEFVRASMSIPVFFEPYMKNNLPHQGEILNKQWITHAGYYGEVPKTVKFVDGGLLSNFPINIFHLDRIPSHPTFGVRLSTHRKNYSKTSGFFSYTWAIISTMRQIHDYDFILKNPDYRKLICHIDANEHFNWLNFNMSAQRQKELFLLGAKKGLAFLENFDWEAYKEIRRQKTL
ncbi:patatin-like phospholipase family protein [Mesonia aestuariivivens]|uniref:Patatin-like phospholipase family protein n=1 Tax=Mesonia aestuariivivens TaxID=2796128 RepID=A0ABS6VZ36_9FLAO|nr:patatin-like phospholipase family protein [Mesonia aestuariivivens]MBW2960864.1 patatin-like phospholipase family protein [Mesonia aestuariivivens]